MPTADYRNAKGERIPGNTTVISSNLGWSKNGLMYWAWQQGRDGKDFRQTRDSAADAGTLCHAMIEHDIKNLPPINMGEYAESLLAKAAKNFVNPLGADPAKTVEDLISKAETGFLNYLEWKQGVRLVLKTMEVPLISERHQYGTTVDVVADANGKTCFVECKTSNDIYTDYLIQVAAQKAAWDENYPDDPIRGMHILKVHKENASFAHYYFGELPGCFDAFLCLRKLHDFKKSLERLL